MPRKKTEEDYHGLASEKGFEWIGITIPDSVVTKTLWKCPEGHEWETTYNSIASQNSRCHYCTGNAVKIIEDYYAIAEERGFKFLDTLPQNTMTKARWECSNGHVWETTYTAVYSNGRGCPYCAGLARKTTEDYHRLATEKNLQWVGEELPPNIRTVTRWQCLEGHCFEKSYHDTQNLKLCIFCSGYTKTIKDYLDLAKSKGIKWVGSELPTYAKEITEWECTCGKIVRRSYYGVFQRTGLCRSCAYEHGAKQNRLGVRDYIEIVKNKPFYWLGTFVPSNVEMYTLWQCLTCGYKWEASYNSIRNTDNCPLCARRIRAERNRLKPEDYHQRALENGLVWIGKQIPRTGTEKTLWQCENGHTWSTSYVNVDATNDCPHCTGRKPKVIDDYHTLAQEQGIKWIDDKLPMGVHEKTLWQCFEGHQFLSRYGDVRKGHGCPFCAGVARKTETDYHQLAHERNIVWIDIIIPQNTDIPTMWKCQNGHIWNATFASIKHAESGCPHCINLVNGRRISSQQVIICDMVNGELNIFVNGYAVDIVLYVGNIKIAIEYDGWHWHKDKLVQDFEQSMDLVASGWRVLRIKSGMLLPQERILHEAIAKLCNGSTYEEIILEDWGE